MIRNKGKLHRRVSAFVLSLILLTAAAAPIRAEADIYDVSDLIYADWEALGELEIESARGWPQSICVTDKYIVCLINGAAAEAIPDTLAAFNKDDYSFAFEVTERDYEHGNGMTYNPRTHEIYIMPGPCLDKANAGDFYVVDADTLQYKRTFKSPSGQNFGGIEYLEDTDQYVVSGGDGSKFRLMDSEFNILKEIAPRTRPKGTTYQDFCVTGDYIISPCYDGSTKVDNYFVVYSLSQGKYLNTFYADLPGDDEKKEIESLCEIEPGKIMLGVGISNPRRVRLYAATLRAAYDIHTEAENGTISASESVVEGGTDYQVHFQPNVHYELSQLIVDGAEVESDAKQTEYTFHALSGDHTVKAVFTEIPKFWMTTSVLHGIISGKEEIYRDEDWTVDYSPDEYYELDSITIDGTTIDVTGVERSYTFTNIQKAHDIRVKYTEIPSWVIAADVKGGTISGAVRKAYRGSSHTVTYEPEKNYTLFSVKVDGQTVDKKVFAESCTFSNVNGAHSIEVVYVWKYLPLCIGGVIFLLLFLLFYLNVRLKRKRKKQKKMERREKEAELVRTEEIEL